MTAKFLKIAPSATKVDSRYQRALDEKRARKISENFRPDLVGVPVLSERPGGELVRIDGQHRLAAACMAGKGNDPIMMEVHYGLDLQQEAALFLHLNGGRSAVGAIDKYRARLISKEPVAMEISRMLNRHGMKVVRAPTRNGVMAISTVEGVYHLGTLPKTLEVLSKWGDGEAEFLDGMFIRAVGDFLSEYAKVDVEELANRLAKHDPSKVMAKLRRTRGGYECSSREAACFVLREIYNERRGSRSRLPPPKRGRVAVPEAEAAE